MEIVVYGSWEIFVLVTVGGLIFLRRRHVGIFFLVTAISLLPLALLMGRYGGASCDSLKGEYACPCYAIAGVHAANPGLAKNYFARAADPVLAKSYFARADDICPGHPDYKKSAGR